jgi:hypothetical protein
LDDADGGVVFDVEGLLGREEGRVVERGLRVALLALLLLLLHCLVPLGHVLGSRLSRRRRGGHLQVLLSLAIVREFADLQKARKFQETRDSCLSVPKFKVSTFQPRSLSIRHPSSMTQLPYEVWSYVLDEVGKFGDDELWLNTRRVCRLFNEVIKERFRCMLYSQSQCEVIVTFVQLEDDLDVWASSPKNEVFRPVISEEDTEAVERIPEAVFGPEGRSGDRLVWLCHESRLTNQMHGGLVRPEGVKYTPIPEGHFYPSGQPLSLTCHTMFHALDRERRIFRPGINVAAQRAGRHKDIQDDWYLFMEEEETEEGRVWVGRALTVPLAHLMRFAFEDFDERAERKQEEAERRERLRRQRR